MEVILKELSKEDGMDVFEMLSEIGPGENGFENPGYDVRVEDFEAFLAKQVSMSHGVGLKPGWVPQTNYWLYVDGRPVGIGKLRHYLTDALRELGGHIGYTIRPSDRGKGFGHLILKNLLEKARNLGIAEVLLTCEETNQRSRRVIESNGGVLEKVVHDECYYWIAT